MICCNEGDHSHRIPLSSPSGKKRWPVLPPFPDLPVYPWNWWCVQWFCFVDVELNTVNHWGGPCQCLAWTNLWWPSPGVRWSVRHGIYGKIWIFWIFWMAWTTNPSWMIWYFWYPFSKHMNQKKLENIERYRKYIKYKKYRKILWKFWYLYVFIDFIYFIVFIFWYFCILCIITLCLFYLNLFNIFNILNSSNSPQWQVLPLMESFCLVNSTNLVHNQGLARAILGCANKSLDVFSFLEKISTFCDFCVMIPPTVSLGGPFITFIIFQHFQHFGLFGLPRTSGIKWLRAVNTKQGLVSAMKTEDKDLVIYWHIC